MTERKAAAKRPSARRTGARELAAQATRENILRAATKVFARYGYEGGSVEKISRAAKSFDRMIYYYFGSKEGLFIEVIESIYRRMNEAEEALDIRPDAPVEALKAVVRFVSQYYRRNPEFVTLLNTENLHKGRHIAKSPRAREYSSPAVSVIAQVLASGAAAGVFRSDLQARDLYLLIASMGYFYQSNRYTLSAFLGEELDRPEAIAHWDAVMVDVVLRTVAPAR
ncbi:TetR/AcrR family transcriptional regulator [Xylophilus sp. ASV27]|uniref:TetR/AcrR family transcriptional regulator n=1 Tax=Xylophilus sp. ASV27 TaxID=2795129 RepID=UPI0018ED91B6|nr:TetR/AcrR family transcriptional regulator [Xylophilus sp. ASV27]